MKKLQGMRKRIRSVAMIMKSAARGSGRDLQHRPEFETTSGYQEDAVFFYRSGTPFYGANSQKFRNIGEMYPSASKMVRVEELYSSGNSKMVPVNNNPPRSVKCKKTRVREGKQYIVNQDATTDEENSNPKREINVAVAEEVKKIYQPAVEELVLMASGHANFLKTEDSHDHSEVLEDMLPKESEAGKQTTRKRRSAASGNRMETTKGKRSRRRNLTELLAGTSLAVEEQTEDEPSRRQDLKVKKRGYFTALLASVILSAALGGRTGESFRTPVAKGFDHGISGVTDDEDSADLDNEPHPSNVPRYKTELQISSFQLARDCGVKQDDVQLQASNECELGRNSGFQGEAHNERDPIAAQVLKFCSNGVTKDAELQDTMIPGKFRNVDANNHEGGSTDVSLPANRDHAAQMICAREKVTCRSKSYADLVNCPRKSKTASSPEIQLGNDISVGAVSKSPVIEDESVLPLHDGPIPSSGDIEKEPVDWKYIRRNVFLRRPRRKNEAEIMICQCEPPKEDEIGCGDRCLNRLLNIECIQELCPCGKACSNQRFQKYNYAAVEIFQCGTKGYGLRVLEDVRKDTFLIEYVGEVLDRRGLAARQQAYIRQGREHIYFMSLSKTHMIDACLKGNFGRFINHSCEPNCKTEKWMVNGEICVGIFTIRDIDKGEEITFDYNYVCVRGLCVKKCECGHEKCRGFMGVS